MPGYVTEGVKGLTVANVSPDEDEEDETLDKTDCDTGEEEDLDALMDKYKYGYRNVDEVPDPQEESRRSAQKAFQKLAKYRPSLDPPPLHPLSLKEFIMARTEGAHLGRAMDESLEEQSWQCTVWMSTTAAESENTETVTRVVQSVLSSPLFLELFGCEALVEDKEVFKKLPPGVPVQIEIPLLASLVASVLVRGVSPGWFPPPASEEEEQKDWFSIPDVDYREGVIL